MKQIIISFALALLFAAQGFGAGIGENENQSAEFVRMLNRYASTDIDACYFNPAGLVYLKPGWHFYFSNQIITDTREVKDSSTLITKVNGKSLQDQNYTGKAQTFIYPTIYTAYKEDDIAFYFMFSIIGAGASAFFNNGLPVLDKVAALAATFDENIGMGNFGDIRELETDNSIKGLSYYLNATVGTAYRFNRMFSGAFGLRFVYDVEEYKAGLKWKRLKSSKGDDLIALAREKGSSRYDDIDIKVNGTGSSIGLVFGFDIKPHRDWLIGIKSEYYTPMETKLKVTRLNAPIVESLIKDMAGSEIYGAVYPLVTGYLKNNGIAKKSTIPPNISIGVSYQVLEKLRLEASGIYFFNRLTDWGDDLMAALKGEGRTNAESYDNGFGVGIGGEYAVLDNLKASIGMTYSESGRNAASSNEIFINLTTITVGTGATYTLFDNIDITVAAMKVWHRDYVYDNSMLKVDIPILGNNLFGENGQQRLSESTWELAFGLTYRLPSGGTDRSAAAI